MLCLSITWKDPGVDDEFRGLPPCGVARLAPEAAAAAAPPPGGGDGVRIDDDLGNRKWLPPVRILIENLIFIPNTWYLIGLFLLHFLLKRYQEAYFFRGKINVYDMAVLQMQSSAM